MLSVAQLQVALVQLLEHHGNKQHHVTGKPCKFCGDMAMTIVTTVVTSIWNTKWL